MAEPWVSAAPHHPLLLWGHPLVLGATGVSARLPSGHAGWDCSSAHQPSSPPGAKHWELNKYIPLDLYSH